MNKDDAMKMLELAGSRASIRTDKVDKRKIKRYGREARVSIPIPKGVGAYDFILEAFPDKENRPHVRDQYYPNRDYPHVTLVWFFEADKPSKIISEDAAKKLVADKLAGIEGIFLKFLKRAEDTERQKKICEEATHLAEYLGKHIFTEAQKACRYDQRLAALKAELDAEIKAQTEKAKSEKKLQDAVKKSTVDFDSRSVDAALAHIDKFTYRRNEVFRNPHRLTVEEVFPPEEDKKAEVA